MRNLLSIAFLAIFFLTSAMVFKASNIEKADQILGDWKPSNGRSIIRIYKGVKDNGEDPKKYYGKIIWLLEPNDANGNPRTDINNSDDAKKKNKLKGLVNVKELEFVGNDQEWLWENGTIYDPNNGSEYSFKAEIDRKKPNQLLGKGYIGVSLFGREDVWTRMVKK